jgi:hypothetical protein
VPLREEPLLERLLDEDESGDESEAEPAAERAQHGPGFWPSVALLTKAMLGVGELAQPLGSWGGGFGQRGEQNLRTAGESG